MTESTASISMSWVMMSIISMLIVIVGFFLNQKIKKLDKVDDLDKAIDKLGIQIDAMNKTVETLSPVIRMIYDIEKDQAAAWHKINIYSDDVKLLKRRTNELSTWVKFIRRKIATTDASFPGEWDLTAEEANE